MKTVWTSKADRDLEHIEAHISLENPKTAARLVLNIVHKTEALLTAFPHSGKAGDVFGTRLIPLSGLPYRVVYRVSGDTIEILRIFHVAQQWQDQALE